MRSLRLATLAVGVAVTIPMAGAAFAAPAPNLSKSDVKPWTFVGKAGDCGPGYPAGTDDVYSKWLPHAGLPDAHGNADKALVLAKYGLTSDCSSAGASITKVTGITVTELGFDLMTSAPVQDPTRGAPHCGAGAPRFNVVTTDGTFFVGCAAMTADQATKTDDAGNVWTHMTAGPDAAFPGPITGTVESIDIVFDEGTDQGTGYTVLDNIKVNGTVVGH